MNGELTEGFTKETLVAVCKALGRSQEGVKSVLAANIVEWADANSVKTVAELMDRKELERISWIRLGRGIVVRNSPAKRYFL